ncbi:MAG TPA: TlpA disulfide reductase family protein [Thiobacillaceae bacterium]|nr:TlpA disulfide reductase family protein [Thiobacillaceae bacterium]HNU64397.1 TlpA disulfide reductase family protein [Thiobacillaceae bacterium]
MRKILGALLLGLATAVLSVPAAAQGTKAINFQFTDINGKSLRLSDFRGKWVLVNFWAPWCPLCWVEVPTLNELNKRKDFVVIGVGLDYGPDENVVRQTASRHNLEFAHIIAGGARRNQDSPFRQVGPVDFYPTSYLYDPNGEIVMFIPGQVRMSKVLAFMDSYKGKKTQVVEGKQSATTPEPPPVQEVTYTKTEAPEEALVPSPGKPSTRGTSTSRQPARRSRTTTY